MTVIFLLKLCTDKIQVRGIGTTYFAPTRVPVSTATGFVQIRFSDFSNETTVSGCGKFLASSIQCQEHLVYSVGLLVKLHYSWYSRT